MILEYSVKNTYSIGEKQTISFEPTSFNENDALHYIDVDGKKILKLACIYGANAAGKTNMAIALNFYLNFMTYSFYSMRPKTEIPFVPYCFENEKIEDVNGEFELVFYIFNSDEGKFIKYNYFLKLNKKQIEEESLSYYPKKLPRLVFKRLGQKIEWGPSVKGAKKSIEDIILPNCTVISASSKTNLNLVKDVFFYISNRVRKYINPFNNRVSQTLLEKLDTDKSFNEKATGLLSFADFGSISNIEIKRETKEFDSQESVIRQASVVHKYNGKEFALPLGLESAGTLRILELVEPLIDSSLSSMSIIDELEASLHQDLLESFLRLFIELSTNSQLLFTTHNQELLDSGLLLDDEVWFCYKTDEGNSVYNSISDYSGIRKETSRKKLYQAGKFGALPNIDIQSLKDLFYAKKN